MTAQPASIIERLPATLGVAEDGVPGLLVPTSLDRFELLQTPSLWGHDPADNSYWESTTAEATPMPEGSRRLLEAIEDVVAGARTWLDISSLQSFASGAFLEAIRRGLARAAADRVEPLTVRILYGRYDHARPGFVMETVGDFERFVAEVASEVPRGSPVRLYGCFMKTWRHLPTPSWNHSKIVAADGKRAIVGGHNLWHDDYLSFAPVHDVSALIEGPAAGEAHRFLDQLWDWARSHDGKPSENVLCHCACVADGAVIHEACPSRPPFPEAQPGATPVVALGRLGVGVMSEDRIANVGAAAAPVLFSQAQSSIRLSQMDFGFKYEDTNYWRDDIVAALATALTDPSRSVDVRVVLSEVGAEVAVGGGYSFGTTFDEIVAKMREATAGRSVTGRMRLAPIRCSAAGERWRHGERELKFTNHAKVWVVDDRLLYVGSDNIYPHSLQEFGYVIESERIVREVLASYWEPLWRFSSRNVVDVC